MFKFPLGILTILEQHLLAEGLEGVNEIMNFTKESTDDAEDEGFSLLPPVEEIIEKANKVKVTKEEIMTLKKEYEQEHAVNHPKEIKRLPTFFDVKSEEEKDISISNKNIASYTPVQVSTKIYDQNMKFCGFFNFDTIHFGSTKEGSYCSKNIKCYIKIIFIYRNEKYHRNLPTNF